MEALDLAGGGRRVGLGQPLGDALLPADALKQHLTVGRVEPAGEDLAVIGQQLLRNAVALQRRGEHAAHRASGGVGDQSGGHTEPGVVIDPGDHLGFLPAGQPDPAHDVHLPQLHGPIALPAPVVGAASSPLAGLDELVADQRAVDRRPRRDRLQVPAQLPGQLMPQPPRSPPGMLRAPLADARLRQG